MATTLTRPFIGDTRRPWGGLLIASSDSDFRRRWLRNSIANGKVHHEADGGAHALAKLGDFEWERVVLDRRLMDLDAAEVAEMIRERCPRVPVELVDSRGTTVAETDAVSDDESENARESATTEYAEFTEKRANEETAGKCAVFDGKVKTDSRTEIVEEESELVSTTEENLPGMIGTSPAMQELYRLVRIVAPRDTTVLVTGETGTGKELVAQAIHQLSVRAKQPFVTVNCAAIPEALLESELFGYARGAFTGAVQSRLGRIHVAQGGTLFLDEIGEMPLAMQAKLLRFLQNGEVQRLGSPDVYKMDVRVICATNARLTQQVAAKQFRQDLYYRLAVFPVYLPALRHRLEDLEALAQHFLRQLSADAGVQPRKFSREVLHVLMNRRWEGNVRELQHTLERAFILAGNSEELKPEHCRELQEATL